MLSRVYGAIEIIVSKDPGGFVVEARSPDGIDGRDIRAETNLSELDLIDDFMSAFKVYARDPERWWAEFEERTKEIQADLDDNLWFSHLAARLTPYLPEAVKAWEKEKERRAEHRHRAGHPKAGPKEWIPGVEALKRKRAAFVKNLTEIDAPQAAGL